MSSYLIADPTERMNRAAEKESWVLDFLRDEIYSTTKILAKYIVVDDRTARRLLRRMEKKGLLICDEIRFMGMKAVPLWGISSEGMLEGLSVDEIGKTKLKHHTPGRVSPITIAHTLDVQKYRIYLEFTHDLEDWIPTRLLPAQNEKKNHHLRWPVYPDGVGNVQTKNKGQLVVSPANKRHIEFYCKSYGYVDDRPTKMIL